MVGLGGLEPPTSPLSGARSSHLSYRPQHRGEPLTTTSLYGSLARFAIVRNLRFGTRQQLLRCIYHARFPNHSSVHRGMYSPRSVKMQWQSRKVQCFTAFPIYKQNHNGGRSKISLVKTPIPPAGVLPRKVGFPLPSFLKARMEFPAVLLLSSQMMSVTPALQSGVWTPPIIANVSRANAKARHLGRRQSV